MHQTNEAILHDGLTRDYILYVPTTYQVSRKSYRWSADARFTERPNDRGRDRIQRCCESNNFIVAYPSWRWQHGKNTNSGFGGEPADDIKVHIDTLADSLSAEFNVDTARIYSCGFSAGGFLGHRLACEPPLFHDHRLRERHRQATTLPMTAHRNISTQSSWSTVLRTSSSATTAASSPASV
ncbi:MAG: hypothetical protein IPN85_14000 [Flavobacteriales bacterium]|nr:hypothetical protein [Flavobacteriales bacterium]